ncbi:MAG TPA: DNA adenine methylase [Candidatus Polarisedimenticolia bacterium]|nr:DNA adenine methylase [Candidatus Polarisedimenticolia bacterium]
MNPDLDQAAPPARLTPFLKWAGGKGRLIPQFLPHFPASFSRYFEPFLGGGAVFLAIRPRLALLSDLNDELINCWLVVRDRPHPLMSSLDRRICDAQHYYELRAIEPRTLSPVERASRFIYLNKTCYNGLYRVNRAGRFNVPFGRHARPPRLYERGALLAISACLQGIDIACRPFDLAVESARARDFVYFDPPYHPLSRTSSFTSYTKDSFAAADQDRLASTVRALDRRGCYVAVSNSDTPEVRRLYSGFSFRTVLAARAINSQAGGRGRISELLICNYEVGTDEHRGPRRRTNSVRRRPSPGIGSACRGTRDPSGPDPDA